MNKSLENLIVAEYYNGNNKKAMLKKHKMTSREFDNLKIRKHFELKFDEDLFFQRLSHEYLNNTATEFCKMFSLNAHSHKNLKTKMKMTHTKMMSWLKLVEVPYTYEVRKVKPMDTPVHWITYKSYYIEPVVKRESSYEMLPIELEDYKEKLGLVTSQTKALMNLLQEKNISGELQHRIETFVNTIARESLYVGVAASKGGYANRLEYAINNKGEN